MSGFIIGLVCLWGLSRVLRGRHGCGPGWRGRGWHGRGWRGRGWSGGGRAGRYWMLRRVFEKLDTTPGQEREIREAVDEVATVAEARFAARAGR